PTSGADRYMRSANRMLRIRRDAGLSWAADRRERRPGPHPAESGRRVSGPTIDRQGVPVQGWDIDVGHQRVLGPAVARLTLTEQLLVELLPRPQAGEDDLDRFGMRHPVDQGT